MSWNHRVLLRMVAKDLLRDGHCDYADSCTVCGLLKTWKRSYVDS